MKEKAKNFYSVNDLAKLLGVSRIAVFKKIKKGQIRAHKVGRSYVVKADDAVNIIGQELGRDERHLVEQAVRKAVNDYGETLKLLGSE